METINTLRGNCTGHEDPDLWFIESGSGRVSERRRASIAARVQVAIDLCNTCPIKDKCFDNGMLEENLPYGIWGGKLAGERLTMAGYSLDNYHPLTEKGRALIFANEILPLLEA